MNDFNLENFYKSNLIIWIAIIFGMSGLIIVTYIFDQMQIFESVAQSIELKNIFFALILISAMAVLFLKRSFLDFDKIFAKTNSKESSISKTAFFNKLKSNYIIIWALAESIIIIGFIEYVLICDYNSFLLYAIIGLYALAINYPKKSLYFKYSELLDEKAGIAV